jgi:nicotinamide-nucleotide amidase
LDNAPGDAAADLPHYDSLADAAQSLAEALADARLRIVFAESCTAGAVSAALAAIPGISAWLCGSAVTYQEQTKTDWLGVDPADLQRFSAVSDIVTTAMAVGALSKTTTADLAVAVTGHLGPGAPDSLDGVIFIAAAHREIPYGQASGASQAGQSRIANWRFDLASKSRLDRQIEATMRVLQVSQQRVRGHLSGNVEKRRKFLSGQAEPPFR